MASLGDDYFSDGSSYNEYNQAMDMMWGQEHDYDDDSEEFVVEEELPHEDDEYTESDSYEYPHPVSSEDSWANLSSDEAIQKIIEKLPTYSSEDSNDEGPPPPPPLHPASDSDAGSFIEHLEDEKDSTLNDIAPSQLTEYDPIFYLKAIETFQLYVVPHSDSDESITITTTPQAQGQQQSDPPLSPEPVDDQPVDERENKPVDEREKQPVDEREKQVIIPSQATIAVIAQDEASEAEEDKDIQIDAEEVKELKTDDDEPPISPPYRGADAPRKMTKTRIIIKKVKAKRGPKRFKEGMKVRIKNHMKYGGVVGNIRYVGVIDEVKMVGIEILDDSLSGETDGSYKDERYFECEENKAVFLSIKNIQKYVDPQKRKQSDVFMQKSRERRRIQRNNAQMYGNIVDNLWQHRIDLVRTKQYRIVHKAGPREFGRIEYFGGDEEYNNALNDHTHWLAPRLNPPRGKGKQKKAEPKAGPREIGRKESYVGIVYDEEEEARKRAQRKQKIAERKKKKFAAARKKKLKEGAITRADGSKREKSDVKIKGKKRSGSKDTKATNTKPKSRKNTADKINGRKKSASGPKIKKDKKENKVNKKTKSGMSKKAVASREEVDKSSALKASEAKKKRKKNGSLKGKSSKVEK